MKLKLEQLEARLQALIEVRLVSALPGFQVEDLVIHKIADAMRSNLTKDANGNNVAPNVFTLIAHPQSAENWQEPKLLNTLVNSIKIVGEEAGLKFISQPKISIVQQPELPEEQIDILASHQLDTETETSGMTPANDTSAKEGDDSTMPANAFLIIDGVKVFPLTERVVNIGRRLDNQLVIDDPRISRNHAQLRSIKGRFVIFDLNSTGGTFVNAQRTSQSVLYPGDVISLAGVPLVFGQDNPPPRPDLAGTEPLKNASSADRPTVFLGRGTEPRNDDEDQ